MLNLIEIKQKVEDLAGQINGPVNHMLTNGTSDGDGKPYIEVANESYYYQALDRDIRTVNRKTQDVDELLYWVFADVTFNMTCSYELVHRDPQINYRRVIFSYQLELLEKLNSLWRERCEKEIAEILKVSPYDN